MTEQQQIKKLYYSIGEVSELTGLEQYTLRYWETEFPMLRPTKNRAGNRVYKESEIKLVQFIKSLLYDHRYTIEGARQKLKDYKLTDTDLIFAPERSELIKEIKTELQEILNILNHK
jgi:DNA-binding transcriptional MerR regulator